MRARSELKTQGEKLDDRARLATQYYERLSEIQTKLTTAHEAVERTRHKVAQEASILRLEISKVERNTELIMFVLWMCAFYTAWVLC